MAVTHSAAARNAATDAVTALIGVSGNLKFRLAGNIGAPGAVVATLPLSVDAFGDSSGGTAIANPITSDTDTAGDASPVATATFETSVGTIVLHCAVSASGSDINMSGGLTVDAGDTIAIADGDLTYTALTA